MSVAMAVRAASPSKAERSANLPTVLETRVVTGTGGGPDKTILNTPRFIDPYGYRTLCAFFHPPNDPGFVTLRERATAASAPLISVPDRGPFDWRMIRQLVTICREENVSLWHGHDYKSNILGLMIRRFHPMRLITTVHGWVLNTLRSSLYFRVDRWCLPRYERVLCVSPDLRDQCLEAGVAPERCILVENGIDTTQSVRQHSQIDARRILGLPQAEFLIGAVGRLSPEKNFPLLISALERIRNQGRQAVLAIAGEGPEQAALQQLIEERNLGDSVRLLGFLPEPRLLYEACDLVALSSDREGLPNVLLEAMAMGVPVVATRVAGVPRLITQERNGLLVEMKDEAGLAAALSRLIDEPEFRRTLASAGRETIHSRYSFASRTEKIARIYESLNLQDSPNSR